MNNLISIKVVTDEAFESIKKNIKIFTKKVQENQTNDWVKDFFTDKIYTTKVYKINEFTLSENIGSKDRDIDFKNAVTLYENLNKLPHYILSDIKFWLWLILDKFYGEARGFVKINSESTIKGHWLDAGGIRRALTFNVLARLFLRVERTVIDNDYTLTKWIFDNPERFRNLTWRNYSDNKPAILAILKGCKKGYDEKGEVPNIYTEIANFISFLGGSKLIDAYTESELEEVVYKKYCELCENGK